MPTPLREHTARRGRSLRARPPGGGSTTVAPLAQRLRPATLDELVGQEHVVGPGRALRLAIEARPRAVARPLRPARASGKTTLARIVAEHDRRRVRGALGGLGDRRERARGARAGPRAARRRRAAGRSSSSTRSTASTRRSRTRCCPGVEEGLVTLIGATTENPYFELNSALLSRMQVYELEPLSRGASCCEIVAARRRGARRRARAGRSTELIAARAGGDARTRARDPRARRADGRAPRARPSTSATSRTRRASGRCSTTRAATRTTTRSRPGSSRRAPATSRPRSTTSR